MENAAGSLVDVDCYLVGCGLATTNAIDILSARQNPTPPPDGAVVVVVGGLGGGATVVGGGLVVGGGDDDDDDVGGGDIGGGDIGGGELGTDAAGGGFDDGGGVGTDAVGCGFVAIDFDDGPELSTRLRTPLGCTVNQAFAKSCPEAWVPVWSPEAAHRVGDGSFRDRGYGPDGAPPSTTRSTGARSSHMRRCRKCAPDDL
jgi:hypothetical protein